MTYGICGCGQAIERFEFDDLCFACQEIKNDDDWCCGFCDARMPVTVDECWSCADVLDGLA